MFTSTTMENKDQEKEQVTSHLHTKLQAWDLISPALPFKEITPNYIFRDSFWPSPCPGGVTVPGVTPCPCTGGSACSRAAPVLCSLPAGAFLQGGAENEESLNLGNRDTEEEQERKEHSLPCRSTSTIQPTDSAGLCGFPAPL